MLSSPEWISQLALLNQRTLAIGSAFAKASYNRISSIRPMLLLVLLLIASSDSFVIANCAPTDATTPVTVTDETTAIPQSRQLVNGGNTTIDATEPGKIKINVSGAAVKFNLLSKSSSFTANDATASFYQITASSALSVTLPASPADGTIYKFKRVSGTGVVTFTANGSETIDNAGFVGNSLTLNNGGVVELIAVPGGWQVT